jgi:hypothetical protein
MPGFKNTPVTKHVLIGILATSTFTSLLTLKPYTHIQIVPHLLQQWQWWRIPIWMATYSNAGEVLFACLTVYNLRGLERIFGSRKYAVHASYSLILMMLAVLPDLLILYKCYPGPFGVRSGPPSVVIKQIKLSPSRPNTDSFFVAPLIYPPHSSVIHAASRCLDPQSSLPE